MHHSTVFVVTKSSYSTILVFNPTSNRYQILLCHHSSFLKFPSNRHQILISKHSTVFNLTSNRYPVLQSHHSLFINPSSLQSSIPHSIPPIPSFFIFQSQSLLFLSHHCLFLYPSCPLFNPINLRSSIFHFAISHQILIKSSYSTILHSLISRSIVTKSSNLTILLFTNLTSHHILILLPHHSTFSPFSNLKFHHASFFPPKYHHYHAPFS